jgi:hypothetical protein
MDKVFKRSEELRNFPPEVPLAFGRYPVQISAVTHPYLD